MIRVYTIASLQLLSVDGFAWAPHIPLPGTHTTSLPIPAILNTDDVAPLTSPPTAASRFRAHLSSFLLVRIETMAMGKEGAILRRMCDRAPLYNVGRFPRWRLRFELSVFFTWKQASKNCYSPTIISILISPYIFLHRHNTANTWILSRWILSSTSSVLFPPPSSPPLLSTPS